MSGCPMTQHKNKKGRLIAETTFKAVGAARFELATFPIYYRDANTVHKKTASLRCGLISLLSGRQDSNLRPPAPKAGAITGLRYAPNLKRSRCFCGEGGIRTLGTVLPVRRFSKPFLSATQAPHRPFARGCKNSNNLELSKSIC